MAAPSQNSHHRPDASSNHFALSVAGAPVTQKRIPHTDWHVIKHAGVARANIAASETHPEGTTEGGYSAAHKNETVLQQHVTFFDLNGDGILTPYETFTALRLLNWSILLALFAVLIIHGSFSYVTMPPGRILPDPQMRVWCKHIHTGKHGSDSGAFDPEGRIVPQMFADFFTKYGQRMGKKGEWGITFAQAMRGVRGQRCVMDIFGISAAIFEWVAAYITLWPANGVMRMEDVRGIYDGSYFYRVAGDRRAAYVAQHYSNSKTN